MASLRELWTKVSFKVDTNPLEKLQGTLEKVKSRLDVLAAGELLRGMAELTEKFGDFAIDLQNSAEAAGITAEALQALDFAAGEAGIGTGEMGKALATLTKKLQAARLGSEEANIAFGRAGITPDQIGSFQTSTDALKALANTLNKIQDPIARAAAAQETLGESGARMLKFLAGGSEGLDEAMEHAAKVGVIVSEGQLENLASGERAIGVLKKQLTALGEIFVSKLAPALRLGANLLGNFLNKHRAIINATFDKFLYNVGFAMGYMSVLFTNGGKIIDAFLKRFPNAAKYVGIFIAALIGIRAAAGIFGFAMSGIMGGITQLVKTVKIAAKVFNVLTAPLRLIGRLTGSLLKGFGKMFAFLFPRMAAWATATWAAVAPYLAIAAGIAAIIVVSHDLWAMWHGAKFEDTWLGKALHAVKSFGGKVWDKLGLSMPDMNTPGKVIDKASQFGNDAMGSVNGFFESAGALQERTSLAAAGQMVGPKYDPVEQAKYASRGDVKVDAPVTINLQGTHEDTVKSLSSHVQDAIKSQWETVLRSSKTQVTPVADY